MKIGIFDSDLGELLIPRECQKDFVYKAVTTI